MFTDYEDGTGTVLDDAAKKAVIAPDGIHRPSRYGVFRRLFNMRALLLVAAVVISAAPGTSRAEAGLTILAFGDSLTAGYGLKAEDSFPARLEAALRERGYDTKVINAGVSGDTSAGGLGRLDWALADAPQIAIVELGANDGLRGLDPTDTEKNLDAIVGKLKDNGVRVLLTGMMAPPNMGRDYADQFNPVFKRVADRQGVAFYPFFLDGVAGRPELNQGDGIHPSPAGVDVIVGKILPSVEELIKQEVAG